MHIVAALKPNNKFQIKKYRLADGYGRSPGNPDPTHVRETTYSAKQLQEAERLTKLIASASPIKSVTVLKPNADLEDSYWAGELKLQQRNYMTVDVCELPESITMPVLSDGKPTGRLEHVNYWDAVRRRLSALDLLKKSQHEVAKPRPWGLPTKPKEFRWQAGEKILEGGSIIDRFVGAENSSMITLTLPGSTWYAMDALARWSGWIVNRLTQVVRRAKCDACEKPYWFFVWEHQKRGALHMHWCLAWDTLPQKRLHLCHQIKDKWFQLLEEISVKEGIDLFKRGGYGRSHRYNRRVWQWDIQDIRKSVAAYFAKYCEKNTEHGFKANRGTDEVGLGGRSEARKRTTHPNRTYPSRYWGSSQTVKQWSKRLTREQRWTVDSPEFADIIANRIREAFPRFSEFVSISEVPFEVVEPTTGICIASGVTQTYIIPANLYPDFHSHMCNEVFERPYCMDAMDKAFLDTGGSCRIDVSKHPMIAGV